jgi:hypothetical protein
VTLDRLLREGFSDAHRRIGLVLLDLVWKLIWFVVTAAALSAMAAWFGFQLRSLGWVDTANPTINSAIAFTLLRKFWAQYRAEVLLAVAALLFLSIAVWFVLEAAFRSRMIAGPFPTFLVARVLKCFFVASATLLLTAVCFGRYFATPISEWSGLWPDTAGSAVIILAAIAALGFLLTIIETLIRIDAIELLGTDLFRVTGVIGILLLFEIMVSGSLAVMVAAGFLNIAGLPSVLVMAGTAVVALIFMNALHSYLLLVRFSAIGIMRQNVVEI